jgi:phage-related minor tail protein
MSGHGFHVHGPHDHEMEHAAQHGGGVKGMTGQLAMITAVLASFGAMFSHMGGLTQAEAALAKNDAAIRKTEASDQWNFYQAKNERQFISEVARDIAPAALQDKYAKAVEKYKSDKDPIMEKAKHLEEESEVFNKKSETLMQQHERWAEAATLLQVSIALAAIALLTRARWLEWGTLVVASVGLVLGAFAFLAK